MKCCKLFRRIVQGRIVCIQCGQVGEKIEERTAA